MLRHLLTSLNIIPPHYRWARSGDLNAFFGLMLDNMSDLVIMAALLGSIAGVAVVLIAFLPALDVFSSPVVGFLSLGVILVSVVGGRSLPFRIPGAFGAVVLGVIVYYVLVFTGLQDGKSWADVTAAATLHVAWSVPTLAFFDGIPTALKYLPVAIPWAAVTVVGGIDCTESAAAAGDEYNTRHILLVEGFSTVIGGLCGGVLQSTPYIGHPAYKRMGGRAAYTLATALFIGLGGILGYLSFLVELIPKAATSPILMFIGLEITAQAFTETPKRHAPAVALAFVPVIANLVVVMVGQFLPVPGVVAANAQGTWLTLTMLANGFIFTSMIWAGGAAFLTDGKYGAASMTFLAGAVCTVVGVMHSPLPYGDIFLPWELSVHASEVWTMATAYAMLAGGSALLMLWESSNGVPADSFAE